MVISLPLRAEYESLSDYLEATLAPADRERVGLISFNHWNFALGAVAETALGFTSIGSEVTIGFWADDTPLPDTGWTTSRKVARLVRSRTRDQVTEQALLAAVGFAEQLLDHAGVHVHQHAERA